MVSLKAVLLLASTSLVTFAAPLNNTTVSDMNGEPVAAIARREPHRGQYCRNDDGLRALQDRRNNDKASTFCSTYLQTTVTSKTTTTVSNTATIKATIKATSTSLFKSTVTATTTVINTDTSTSSVTDTTTNTAANTVTDTLTNTATSSVTNTATDTATNTVTDTITDTTTATESTTKTETAPASTATVTDPTTLRCQINGYGTATYSIAGTSNSPKTFVDCKVLCAATSACKSFGFGAATCGLYSVNAQTNARPQPVLTLYNFYDANCPSEFKPAGNVPVPKYARRGGSYGRIPGYLRDTCDHDEDCVSRACECFIDRPADPVVEKVKRTQTVNVTVTKATTTTAIVKASTTVTATATATTAFKTTVTARGTVTATISLTASATATASTTVTFTVTTTVATTATATSTKYATATITSTVTSTTTTTPTVTVTTTSAAYP